jgi:hypothetical protein
MSLKAFHVVFIVASFALAVGVGGWALREWRAGEGGGYAAMGFGSLALAVAIIPYSIWFLRKLKRVSYL